MNHTTSGPDPASEERRRDPIDLLWLPFFCLGVALILYFLGSFLHYHFKRKRRRREILRFAHICKIGMSQAPGNSVHPQRTYLRLPPMYRKINVHDVIFPESKRFRDRRPAETWSVTGYETDWESESRSNGSYSGDPMTFCHSHNELGVPARVVVPGSELRLPEQSRSCDNRAPDHTGSFRGLIIPTVLKL